MGACLSSPAGSDAQSQGRSGRGRSSRRSHNHGGGSPRKNQPLKPELPRWKNDTPLTLGQLSSKRDEFWDTAPAFDGRKEIWDALKAAAYASETKDFELAQAILNGANITIPRGYLTDCYDELGNRYQLPVYVLSRPTNLQHEDTEDENVVDNADNDPGEQVVVKLRLSTGKDLKLTVGSKHSVKQIKRTLAKAENVSEDQRWYYGGKLLQDKLRIEDTKVPKGHLIQVVIPYVEGEPDATVDVHKQVLDESSSSEQESASPISS
ncbi:ubiquitin domain-containing protein 1-like isoform X2 [Watersipora subatra]|uniref:ubiquitin domain-containing protein 1-like isoform X2 n=1 Tax=Watersipora subatra TaxID=2589382 RepID=UPI00355B9463